MAQEDQPIILPKVKCTSTDCEKDKHCFRPPKKSKLKVEDFQGGRCQACNADVVDWEQVYNRDICDVDTLFSALQKEYVRHVFWTVELSDQVKKKLMRDGRAKLEEDVIRRLQKSVECAGRKMFRDGMQTPMNKHNIIYFAQHATATCCRKCIRYWHNIPYDRNLTHQELQYLTELVLRYVDIRVPNIPT
jgi:hypothetical protein